jgi:hypothetical protein
LMDFRLNLFEGGGIDSLFLTLVSPVSVSVVVILSAVGTVGLLRADCANPAADHALDCEAAVPFEGGLVVGCPRGVSPSVRSP